MLNGFFIVRGVQVRKSEKKQALKCDDARMILEFAICADEGVNKVFVCYSRFGKEGTEKKANKICNAMQKGGINAEAVAQNIFSLISPSATSIRFCGTLTKDKIQSFEQIAAASAAKLTMP